MSDKSRRMKANPKCCNTFGNKCSHLEEHDEIFTKCEVIDNTCVKHGCTPVLDLDGLAERVAAIEAEMPRIAKVEEKMGNLNKRVGNVEANLWRVNAPKSAEPEQHQCVCGLFHYRSDGTWKIGNPNSKAERETKEKSAAEEAYTLESRQLKKVEKEAADKAEWEKLAKPGAMVEFIADECPSGEHTACRRGGGKGNRAVLSEAASYQHSHERTIELNFCCARCARVIPSCPTCGHELHKEK